MTFPLAVPRPTVGDFLCITVSDKEFIREVSNTFGQYVFVGHYRFHVRDDYIGHGTWRVPGASISLLTAAHEVLMEGRQ